MTIFGTVLLFVQSAAAPPQPVPPQSPPLSIVVMEGEGAINNIRKYAGRDPLIEVQDENGKPVPGATVVFTLPAQGAGGSFAVGGKIATVNTDNAGRAVARGFRPNRMAGRFEIRVNASWRDRTARAAITQFNMVAPAARKSTGAKLAAVAIAGGAAAAVAVVVGRRNGSGNAGGPGAPAQPSTIVLNPVSSSVGPPR